MSVKKHISKDRGRRRRELWESKGQFKRCPSNKCQVRNSVNAAECWKCGALFTEASRVK